MSVICFSMAAILASVRISWQEEHRAMTSRRAVREVIVVFIGFGFVG